MPIRALGNLLPLRCPVGGRFGPPQTPNLLSHHRQYYPCEQLLIPGYYYPSPGVEEVRYDFYGRQVTVACSEIGLVGHFPGRVVAIDLPKSEVSAIALENAFGKASTDEEVFSVDWGMISNRIEGKVFWDQDPTGEDVDRIIAKTEAGIVLAVQGTNIVEAAVYLPRLYKMLQEGKIILPRPTDIVEIKIAGQENWSASHSPTQVRISVPNLAEPFHPFAIEDNLANALATALINRR